MTTVSGLAATILQSATSQVLGAPNSSQPQSVRSGPAAPGTAVSLGSASSPSPTYNALGQLSSAQITQLEQAINTDVGNTVSALFSNSQSGATDQSSLYSVLAGLSSASNATAPATAASQAAQAVLNSQNAVNNTLASMLFSSSGSSVSPNSSGTDLYSLIGGMQGAPAPAGSSTQTTLQNAILAAQNAVTSTQGAL
jgi:hypothetical protein